MICASWSILAKSCDGDVVDTIQIIKILLLQVLEYSRRKTRYYKNIKIGPCMEDYVGLAEKVLFKWHTQR